MYIVTERYRSNDEFSGPPVQLEDRESALQLAMDVMGAHPEVRCEVNYVPDGQVEENRCNFCGECHFWNHCEL
jgi:hypothetical protein